MSRRDASRVTRRGKSRDLMVSPAPLWTTDRNREVVFASERVAEAPRKRPRWDNNRAVKLYRRSRIRRSIYIGALDLASK